MSRAAPADSAAEVGWLVREGASVDVIDDAPLVPRRRGNGCLSPARRQPACDWDTLVEVVRETHGVVHGLVNNAGITHRARLGDVTLDDLNRVLAVNVTGAPLGIQALTPLMPPGSSIVNVGSVAALTAHYGRHGEQVGAEDRPAWRAGARTAPGSASIRSTPPHRDADDRVGPGRFRRRRSRSRPQRLGTPSTSRRSSASCCRTSRRTERRGDRDRRRSVGAWRCEGTVGRPPRGGGGRDDETSRVERRRTARRLTSQEGPLGPPGPCLPVPASPTRRPSSQTSIVSKNSRSRLWSSGTALAQDEALEVLGRGVRHDRVLVVVDLEDVEHARLGGSR